MGMPDVTELLALLLTIPTNSAPAELLFSTLQTPYLPTQHAVSERRTKLPLTTSKLN
jgi:hypothetical protein